MENIVYYSKRNDSMNIEEKKNFLISYLYVIVVLSIIFLVFKFLSVYFMPFLIGIFVSFVVQRPVRKITERTRINKPALTIFFVVLTYIMISLLVSVLFYFIYIRLMDFAKTIPGYIPELQHAFEGINLKISDIIRGFPEEVVASLNNLPKIIVETTSTSLTEYLTHLTTDVLKSAPELLITIIVTVVASCFIASDYDNIIKFCRRQLSAKTWDIVIHIKELFSKNILLILRGYLILMFITFLELCVFLALLGKPNFATIAAIIALIDVLPVLGTGTIVIPWALISLLMGNLYAAAILALCYLVVTVVRNFLEPKIVGMQIGLNPVIMLISLFVGLKLIGFAGMFLFPLTIFVITDLQDKGKISIWK